MNYSLVTLFLAGALGLATAQAHEPMVSIAQRDLENLAIIDTIHPCTLEKRLNGCHTQSGKAYFERSLRELSGDSATLELRQQHLMQFLQDVPTLALIREKLKACGAAQGILTTLRLEGTEGEGKRSLLDEFYFKRSQCVGLNSSPTALTASFFLHYVNLFAPLLEHALLHAGIRSVFSSLEGNDHDHDHDDHHHHHDHGCGCGHAHGVSSSSALYYLVQGAHWAMHVPGYYEMITHMQARRKKISTAQADIALLKNYLVQVRDIYAHITRLNPAFLTTHTPTLNRLFEQNTQDAAANMVVTILDSSWDSSLQNSFSPGSILAMYAKILKQSALLQAVADEIGIIDAYMTVAHIIDAQTPKNPYCFVRFAHGEQPSITMQGLWHHAIAPDAIRPLSVTLDGANRCQIIKGANGTGKSTTLTALGQALFLAQSWGIAPARTAMLTPFTQIHTHSLKRDAIEQGLSHFYAEHAYYESMFTRSGTGMSIALFDEPYTCTDPQTGAKYLKELVDRVQESPNRLAVMTTHYAL